jgi:DNA-binding transcriptional MerR regulator
MELKRRFYTATQVARRLRIPRHVLRYWEAEFEIKPERNSAGRRIYSQTQVDKLAEIKFLRYREKMTIKGARAKLATLTTMDHGRKARNERKATLLWLKKELVGLRDVLSSDA